MLLPITLNIIFAISFVTMALYGTDKVKAVNGAWRIPEKVLLLFSFFGGALGGTLGMFLFRHKTQHPIFYLINFLGLAWQIALVVFLTVLKFKA